MSLIDTHDAATRLAHAIARDILLYNEDVFLGWLERGGAIPESLAQAILEGNGLFTQRVTAVSAEGGQVYLTTTVAAFEAFAQKKKRPSEVAIAETLGHLLRNRPEAAAVVAPRRAIETSTRDDETAGFIVPVSGVGLSGRLIFFTNRFTFEHETGNRDYPYDEIREVRVVRAARGYELAVRAEFEERWRMNAADALAVMMRLLPLVVRER